MQNEYLYLHNENGVIGVLHKADGYYEFKYHEEYNGNAITAFPNKTKVYKNKLLFTFFKIRLPDKRRKDIKCILHNLGIKKYDEFELLKRTKGIIPTDKFYLKK